MKILLTYRGTISLLDAAPGKTLLSVCQEAGAEISAVCGGRGTCGKCRVLIGYQKHSVLACQTRVGEHTWADAGVSADDALPVVVPELGMTVIETGGDLPDLLLDPEIERICLSLRPPSLEDQSADDERLIADSSEWRDVEGSGAEVTGTGRTGLDAAAQERRVCVDRDGSTRLPLGILRKLPDYLRAQDFHVCMTRSRSDGAVRRLDGDSAQPITGMAVDIGTTTLAAYLYDLENGRLLAGSSRLNPQRSFGADVISRIERATAGHLDELQRAIGVAIADLAAALCKQAGLTDGDNGRLDAIQHITIAGNTTMMHLLAGIHPRAIAVAPFIPATLRSMVTTAATLGLDLPAETLITLLPSMSGYVGADITAGLLANGIDSAHIETGRRNLLFLDIGTNGEIVLVGNGAAYACSTAAGPAFEGANIACGIGGVSGAIDDVYVKDGDLRLSRIGGPSGMHTGVEEPEDEGAVTGICGSGLIAATARFLETGLIDEAGNIADPDDVEPALAARIYRHNGMKAIALTADRSIYLTQKDIREIQNAKAAIAAGIEILLRKAGLTVSDLDEVLLAGGFGAHIGIADALRIGLLPTVAANRVRSVGNASGMGASAVLLQRGLLAEADRLAQEIRYLELSSEPTFSDIYIDSMFFPEE